MQRRAASRKQTRYGNSGMIHRILLLVGSLHRAAVFRPSKTAG
jgi:hypothetical protein